MNAQALKKFVEENRKLATECLFLTGQCEKWERECSLYDHDRDALMEFGNEADQRAREAENRFHELQEEVRRLSDELLFFKHEYERKRVIASPLTHSRVVSLIFCIVKKVQYNGGHDICGIIVHIKLAIQIK